eukprot:SAG11_NODE_22107_length_412_cov_0.664537_1_plen_43_part_01
MSHTFRWGFSPVPTTAKFSTKYVYGTVFTCRYLGTFDPVLDPQ